MTKEEMQEILERLGVKEGVHQQTNKNATLEMPKAKEMVSLLTTMKEMFEKELKEEEAKIVALQEKMVKAKKGGCNG